MPRKGSRASAPGHRRRHPRSRPGPGRGTGPHASIASGSLARPGLDRGRRSGAGAVAGRCMGGLAPVHTRRLAPDARRRRSGPGRALGTGVPRGAGGGSFVRISPNGERLVFLANGRLMTTRLSEGVSVSIAGTEGASSFFFSPDGQAMAFVAGGKLKRVALDGGAVSTICECVPVVRGCSWANDVIVLGGTGIDGGLMRVPAGGGTVEPLLLVAAGEFTQRGRSSCLAVRPFCSRATTIPGASTTRASMSCRSLTVGARRSSMAERSGSSSPVRPRRAI